MDYTNWDWPQWLIIGWWIFATVFALGALVVKPNASLLGRNIGVWTGRVLMFTVLYFGGFLA